MTPLCLYLSGISNILNKITPIIGYVFHIFSVLGFLSEVREGVSE
jgi:hypothetical protein